MTQYTLKHHFWLRHVELKVDQCLDIHWTRNPFEAEISWFCIYKADPSIFVYWVIKADLLWNLKKVEFSGMYFFFNQTSMNFNSGISWSLSPYGFLLTGLRPGGGHVEAGLGTFHHLQLNRCVWPSKPVFTYKLNLTKISNDHKEIEPITFENHDWSLTSCAKLLFLFGTTIGKGKKQWISPCIFP